jgi:hypothetical protein
MKKMSAKSTQRCTYCKSRADWRSNGLASVKYACKNHIEDLRKHQEACDKLDNGHMSEADHQTWGRYC